MPIFVDVLPDETDLCLAVDKDQFIKAQQSDNTLAACLFAAQEQKNVTQPVTYLFDGGVLLCNGPLCLRWSAMRIFR